jgi:hypothetical protein
MPVSAAKAATGSLIAAVQRFAGAPKTNTDGACDLPMITLPSTLTTVDQQHGYRSSRCATLLPGVRARKNRQRHGIEQAPAAHPGSDHPQARRGQQTSPRYPAPCSSANAEMTPPLGDGDLNHFLAPVGDTAVICRGLVDGPGESAAAIQWKPRCYLGVT